MLNDVLGFAYPKESTALTDICWIW